MREGEKSRTAVCAEGSCTSVSKYCKDIREDKGSRLLPHTPASAGHAGAAARPLLLLWCSSQLQRNSCSLAFVHWAAEQLHRIYGGKLCADCTRVQHMWPQSQHCSHWGVWNRPMVQRKGQACLGALRLRTQRWVSSCENRGPENSRWTWGAWPLARQPLTKQLPPSVWRSLGQCCDRRHLPERACLFIWRSASSMVQLPQLDSISKWWFNQFNQSTCMIQANALSRLQPAGQKGCFWILWGVWGVPVGVLASSLVVP